MTSNKNSTIERLLKMEERLDTLISEKKENLENINKKIDSIKDISSLNGDYRMWIKETQSWVKRIIYELEQIKGE